MYKYNDNSSYSQNKLLETLTPLPVIKNSVFSHNSIS